MVFKALVWLTLFYKSRAARRPVIYLNQVIQNDDVDNQPYLQLKTKKYLFSNIKHSTNNSMTSPKKLMIFYLIIDKIIISVLMVILKKYNALFKYVL